MTASDDGLFRRYRGFELYEYIIAAEITAQNLVALAQVAGAEIMERESDFPVLAFAHEKLGKEVAEIGDYVITDQAGACWPIDKEPFEAKYVLA